MKKKTSISDNDIEALKHWRINYLDIEPTSRCDLNCDMCGRSYSQEHTNLQGDISRELLAELSRCFSVVGEECFGGFCEPLMYHDIVRTVRIAHDSGTSVTINTAGILLSSETSRALIGAGLDSINVSLSASTPELEKEIRGSDSFHTIVSNLRRLIELKKELGSEKPRVTLVCVMTKRNIHQLPAIVALGGRLGVDRVRGANLVPAHPEHLAQVLYPLPGTENLTREDIVRGDAFVESAQEIGKLFNIPRMDINKFRHREKPSCGVDENMLHISWRGDVSVCNVASHKCAKVREGARVEYVEAFVIGNLHENTLADILDCEKYRLFREAEAHGELPEICKGCGYSLFEF